jgi:DNA modification methylase
MNGKEITIPFDQIKLGDRFRVAYRDIELLGRDIHQNGIIHPIVVDQDFNLRVGGRRYHAYLWLREQWPEAYDTLPVRQIDNLTKLKERMVEMAENLSRSDMTWQEKCVGIAEVHRLAELDANAQGLGWVQSQTAKELGVSQTNVSFNITIAKILRDDPSGPISQCTTLGDAIRLKIGDKLDETNKLLRQRVEKKRREITEVSQLSSAKETKLELNLADPDGGEVGEGGELISYDTICSMLFHGNALTVLPEIAKGTEIHHIITDPPYGVDPIQMDTLVGHDRVVNQHQVGENLILLEAFLDVAYKVIHPAGFLCMWYDLDHHEKIYQWAKKIGWRVQRWPFIWVKPNSGNNTAQYNVSKCTEYCYFMRRSEKSVLAKMGTKNWIECPNPPSQTHPFFKGGLLWETLIDLVSHEGQTIVDPFCGEGSSLIPMFYRNRNPIGIELVEEHIASAAVRMYAALNKSWMWEDRKDAT